MSLPEKPETRREQYLSVMAGQGTVADLPESPKTREEEYLDYIARNGGGGGGDVTKAYVDQQDALKVDKTSVGVASGVAELDSNGKVPSSQLPSYVDDVIEGYYKVADGKFYEESTYETEITGTEGKIYVSLDTDKCYRWSGSEFVEISESLALGETSSTAYAGNKGKANADAIIAMKDGVSIDSFGDVETALAEKISKSLTAGLVKNDGSIDTNIYITDISGKADKVSSATDGNFAGLDENGNLTDSGKTSTDFATASDMSDVQGVIPSTATTSNKLATASDVADENISATATNTSFSLSDATNGRIQGLTVEGRTTKTDDVINNVGDNGFGVTSCGKNILKAICPQLPSGGDSKTLEGITFKVYRNDDGEVEKIVANGTATRDAGFQISTAVTGLKDVMKKYVGKTVTCSGCPANGSLTTYSILMQGFEQNGIGKHDTGNGVTAVVADPTNFTAAYQIVIMIHNGYTASNLVFRPQLELGSTATVFEPYTGSTASLTTGLPLCSVGDVKDEGDYNRGVGVKRTAKIVLNGTENWYLENDSPTSSGGSKALTYTFETDKLPVEITGDELAHAISDKLTATSRSQSYWGDVDDVFVIHQTTQSSQVKGFIRVRITGIATVSDLTTYLASNPVTVVYELATPYEDPMTAAEVTAYHALRTYEDTTNITATDSPTMTVDYLLDTENGKAVGKVVDDTAKQLLNLLSLIAVPYDDTATYALGAYCTENNTLYKCTTAVSSAEPFDPEKWTATTIMAEI